MMHVTVGKVILTIVAAILFLIIYDEISTILTNIGKYFDAKTKDVQTDSLIKRQQKIDISRNYIDIIDYMITNEISRIIETYALLKNRYEIRLLDEDLAKIATNIFNGLKKDFLNDDSIIFTEEYMMLYITNRCRLLLFNTITEYNSQFAVTSSPEE